MSAHDRVAMRRRREPRERRVDRTRILAAMEPDDRREHRDLLGREPAQPAVLDQVRAVLVVLRRRDRRRPISCSRAAWTSSSRSLGPRPWTSASASNSSPARRATISTCRASNTLPITWATLRARRPLGVGGRTIGETELVEDHALAQPPLRVDQRRSRRASDAAVVRIQPPAGSSSARRSSMPGSFNRSASVRRRARSRAPSRSLDLDRVLVQRRRQRRTTAAPRSAARARPPSRRSRPPAVTSTLRDARDDRLDAPPRRACGRPCVLLA